MKYQDLADLDEDDRIKLICEKILSAPRSSADRPPLIGFIVENFTKADRYIGKIKERYPTVRIIDKKRQSFGTILVRLGAPLL